MFGLDLNSQSIRRRPAQPYVTLSIWNISHKLTSQYILGKPRKFTVTRLYYASVSDRTTFRALINLTDDSHLLGKKSWNVYNTDNVARVHRDEAEAATHEAAEEQRMQEVDSERRLQILRDEVPVPLHEPPEDLPKKPKRDRGHEHFPTEVRKRRRLAGEDDTDKELRYALEDKALAAADNEKRMVTRLVNNAPITDHAGHISLFPPNAKEIPRKEKNAEAEAEAAKRKRELEDQYTMRFSNAAGFKQRLQEPWYSSTDRESFGVTDEVRKDVWGNEDLRRKDREAKRMVDSDPLAFMKNSVGQLREAKESRKKWVEEKEREMNEMKRAEKSERRSRRKRKDGNEESLEAFSLGEPAGALTGGQHMDRTRDLSKDGERSNDRVKRPHHRHNYKEHPPSGRSNGPGSRSATRKT